MASAKANPKVKDFKKLNKVVLAEGATNSMVSCILLFESILINVTYSHRQIVLKGTTMMSLWGHLRRDSNRKLYLPKHSHMVVLSGPRLPSIPSCKTSLETRPNSNFKIITNLWSTKKLTRKALCKSGKQTHRFMPTTQLLKRMHQSNPVLNSSSNASRMSTHALALSVETMLTWFKVDARITKALKRWCSENSTFYTFAKKRHFHFNNF